MLTRKPISELTFRISQTVLLYQITKLKNMIEISSFIIDNLVESFAIEAEMRREVTFQFIRFFFKHHLVHKSSNLFLKVVSSWLKGHFATGEFDLKTLLKILFKFRLYRSSVTRSKTNRKFKYFSLKTILD